MSYIIVIWHMCSLWLDHIVTVLIERNIKSQIFVYLLDINIIIKRKNKTKQNKTKQKKTKQNKTKNKTKQNKTKQNKKKTSFWSMNIQAKHTVNIGLSS